MFDNHELQWILIRTQELEHMLVSDRRLILQSRIGCVSVWDAEAPANTPTVSHTCHVTRTPEKKFTERSRR